MLSKTRCRSLWIGIRRWIPSLALLAAILPTSIVHAADIANPTVTASPTLASGALTYISGTATDDVGLKRVDVYIYRSYTGVKQYFNFSTRTWGTALPTSLAVIPNPDTIGNPTSLNWAVDTSVTGFAWPNVTEMPSGTYNLEVRSVDTSNKTSSYSRPVFKAGPVDSTLPEAALTSPVPPAVVDTTSVPTAISGYSYDPIGNGVASGMSTTAIVFYRDWDKQYWNATTSAWSSTVVTNAVTLGAPDGNGHCAWTLSNMPSSLSPAKYIIRVNTADRYNNGNATYFTLSVTSVGATLDTTAPELSIDSPANNAALTSVSSWTGKVREANVASFTFWLWRWRGGAWQYWDGNNWIAVNTKVTPTLGAPDVDGFKAWNATTGYSGGALPSGANLLPGKYNISASVTDLYNQTTTLNNNFHITPAGGSGQPDTTAPIVVITAPTENQVFTALTQFTGTAADTGAPLADQTGLSHVRIMLTQHLASGNLNWNGTAWQSANYYLNPTSYNSTTGEWALSTSLPSGSNLPSGNYSISLSATDNATNASTTATVNFKVNTRPVGVAQTIKAGKNVARPVVLGATDANGDAITSWRIVTPPAHGTLTGTAPNLTYNPANNYLGTDSFVFAASDWEGEGTTATVGITVMEDSGLPTAVILDPEANEHFTTAVMTGLSGEATDTGTGIGTVTVQIYRDWGGITRFWTGTDWSTTSSLMSTTLGAPDGNGKRVWSVSFPTGGHLPTGSSELPVGRYFARATARDYANRAVTVTNIFYSGGDTTAPSGTLQPVSGPLAVQTGPSDLADTNGSLIKGTFTDAGLTAQNNTFSRVAVNLMRSWSGPWEYWNGTGWSASAPAMSFTATTPDVSNNVSWQATSPMPPKSQLPRGAYRISVVFYDTSNNSSSTFNTIQVGTSDTTAPTVILASPTASVLPGLTVVAGTADDTAAGSGVSQVSFRLKRLSDGKFWNGTAWGTPTVALYTTLTNSATAGVVNWSYTSGLPSAGDLTSGANYTIQPIAVDRYGNNTFGSVFTFTYIPPPVAAGQTLYTTKNTALSVTLSATDPESRPLTYTVVSSPSHGTLTGTAPNLTYTPASNYTGGDSFQFKANNGQVDSQNTLVVINVLPDPYPDGQVKWWGDVNLSGVSVFNLNGAGQIAEARTITSTPATPATYLWRVRNASTATGTFNLTGTGGGGGWTVKYYDVTTSAEITSSVTSTGWATPSVLGSEYRDIRVEITPDASVALGGTREVLMTATHTSSGGVDVVRTVTGKQALITWSATAVVGGNTVGVINCLGIRRVLPDNTGKWLLESNLAYDEDYRLASDNGTTLSTARHTDPCSYTWTVTRTGYPTETFIGQHAYWIPPDPGTYTVTLMVDDGNGGNQTLREIGSRNDAQPTENLTNDPPIVFTTQAVVQ